MPRTTLETKVYTKNWPLCFVNWPAPAPVSYSFVFSCFNHHVNFSKNRYEKISVSYPTLGFKLITTKEGVQVRTHFFSFLSVHYSRNITFLQWAIPVLFSFFYFLYFRLFNSLKSKHGLHKVCRWLESNCGPLASEAIALPIEPQPLPIFLLI